MKQRKEKKADTDLENATSCMQALQLRFRVRNVHPRVLHLKSREDVAVARVVLEQLNVPCLRQCLLVDSPSLRHVLVRPIARDKINVREEDEVRPGFVDGDVSKSVDRVEPLWG